MAKLHSIPGRKSDAETSFRELAESDAPEREAPRGSDPHDIEAALRRAAEPQSRPAHERVSEVRISAPSTIEEAVLRVVEELDAFVPIDRSVPKA